MTGMTVVASADEPTAVTGTARRVACGDQDVGLGEHAGADVGAVGDR